MLDNIGSADIQTPIEHDIQIATDLDMKPVSEILASAFSHDPVINWICDHPEIYSTFFRMEAEALYKRHSHVYINKENTGAAMWLPPGVAASPPFHWRLLLVSWKLASKGGVRSLKRVDQLEKLLTKKHLKEPHFYLRSVGASFENQGRGIGSALLKTGLSDCDKVGAQAYLESTNEKNNPLYERFGFVVTGEESLPDGGPTIWLMKRDARI